MRKNYVVLPKIVVYLELGLKNSKPNFALDFDEESTNLNFEKLKSYLEEKIEYNNINILKNIKQIIVDLSEEDIQELQNQDFIDKIELVENRN